MRLLSVLVLIILSSFSLLPDPDGEMAGNPNRICGKWESSEKNLVVEVYPFKNTFRAKMIRFTGGVTKDKPMESITDKKNPDPALRNRKVLGLDVVDNLKYNPKSNSWEGGRIYEVQSGKYWSAAASIDNSGLLKVKGYWKMKLFGKTMTFHKI